MAPFFRLGLITSFSTLPHKDMGVSQDKIWLEARLSPFWTGVKSMTYLGTVAGLRLRPPNGLNPPSLAMGIHRLPVQAARCDGARADSFSRWGLGVMESHVFRVDVVCREGQRYTSPAIQVLPFPPNQREVGILGGNVQLDRIRTHPGHGR